MSVIKRREGRCAFQVSESVLSYFDFILAAAISYMSYTWLQNLFTFHSFSSLLTKDTPIVNEATCAENFAAAIVI